MKKIINRRKYDTDTAKKVGSVEIGLPGDLDHMRETLYRKVGGEYFVHGEGGARTRYAAESESGGWRSGEAIAPMDAAAARTWAEANLTADEYEAEFGEVSDGPAVVTSVSLPPAIAAKLARMSSTQGRSRSEIVAELIDRAGE